jgi:fimbrial chaperone protein
MRSISGITPTVAAAAACIFVNAASAAQLRVEPVLLELNAPTAAGVLTLRNDDDTAVAVQTRVYLWSQASGRESLEATADVVASPPIVRLAPHADYTVRIVRTSKQPVRGEESYRVIVDQLPDARRRVANTVAILIRQSIPVFFRAAQVSKASVSWSLAYERDRIVIKASNAGDERLRVAALGLRDAAGSTIGFGNGLVGYVLGRSTMDFVITRPPPGFGAGGPVLITAASNNGPINATVPLELRR